MPVDDGVLDAGAELSVPAALVSLAPAATGLIGAGVLVVVLGVALDGFGVLVLAYGLDVSVPDGEGIP